MRGHLLLLIFGLYLLPITVVAQQSPRSSQASEEAAAPGDSSQSSAATRLTSEVASPHQSQSPQRAGLANPDEEETRRGAPASLGIPLNHPGDPLAPDGDNQKLREQILNELRAHSSLASSSFDVEVSDSQIELSGSVPTAHEREIARRIAQSYGNNRGVVAAKIGVRNAGGARETQAPQQ